MAKKGQQQRKYSAEFKIGVIIDMREHRLGYNETIRKYQLGGIQTGGARNMLRRWERIFLEEGAEGLMKEQVHNFISQYNKRQRQLAAGIVLKKKGRPPKLDPKVKEDLIAENQRLRMEIEYLKKLDALVREREERENARKQK